MVTTTADGDAGSVALMADDDAALLDLVRAIIGHEHARVSHAIATSPALVTTALRGGATRQHPVDWFFPEIRHYCYAGDTALHMAAAAYDATVAKQLLDAGAAVGAANRRKAQPLHYAVDGGPGLPSRTRSAQTDTIVCLAQHGADLDAHDANGTTPLLRAVRNRCADAVAALLDAGANPSLRNKRGSTAMQLAKTTSGRGGTGSPEAKAEQQRIVEILTQRSC
jgi:hypothetical protein